MYKCVLFSKETETKLHPVSLLSKWQRFMRKTSIDELPQLFCIFAGSMSIIGDGCIIVTTRKSIDFSRVVTV
jgi:lipopolysaccharide/colanic/teichoic acid biosynthesis glycosyltransferase